MPLDDYRAANLANWNERVVGHTAPDGYDIAGLIDDPERITDVVAFDCDVFGDVTGKTLLHSQCHIGTDTLSWARLGASVTGLDFSPAALASARDTAGRMGIDATFVETEFYDAPDHIHEQFDCVYTSVGAINWLPDIVEWGHVLAGFVKPGGQFYIREGHPMLMALDDERDDDLLVVRYPYFRSGGEPLKSDDSESYAGSATLENTVNYEWPHPVSAVVMALINAGLVIDEFREHTHLDWQFFPFMETSDGERYVMPDSQRELVPLQFSILAHKPS